jgi:ATP-dependent helicase/nuclease subunit B
MKLAAFPPEAAFLPALATAWLAAPGDPTSGLLILPSRRAARAAAGAFLNANQGRPLLLPRIIALGAIDEAGLALQAALDLPPAVPPLTRQAILARLILARDGANGAPTKLHAAWALAADLAALLDEADEAEILLHTALREVVPAELASHWQTTLQFLDIVTDAWPRILDGMGMLNPAARQAKLLDAQGDFWAAHPPAGKIWLVASDAAPALARLAKTIAGLPQGAVILPGYDTNLDEESWQSLDDGHAQAGIARLLTALGARRDDVRPWPAPPAAVPASRAALLSKTLLPAAALHRWQEAGPPPATTGLTRLTPRDESEEATAIAMALRDTLETPGRTAALITPDRQLAQRVAAILQRFGILADDSAGEPLADTPPAIFLRLIARAAAAEFAPVRLLALLKHPLAAAGEPPEICRAHARALERFSLRGPRPPPGLNGLKFRLDQRKGDTEATQNFLARLQSRLAPITGLPEQTAPADALRALIQTAESLAATAQESGAARLWAAEAGAALSERLVAVLEAVESLPDFGSADLPDLLDAILEGGVVRKPRTRDGHPRIAIWGVREAALQTVDTAILAGLVEGVWPAIADPGPWANRPMRKAAGLPAPEQLIGAAAHDFFSLCCRCPEVILSAPTRRGRAPAVPARWLTRLDALLAGGGAKLLLHPAAAWATALDAPTERSLRPKPHPRPPAEARPRELSISDIATLIADPYAIYAKKILRIAELPPLDEESDAALFGNIAHAGLAKFFAQNPDFDAPDAADSLALELGIAMRAERPREALDHWWDARLTRIAGWIVDAERDRRRRFGPPVAIALEADGKMPVGENFTLRGRADRIEARADGTGFIMDYKTGTPPEAARVKDGTAPQLPLEAVMAEAGAFGPAFQTPVTELAFWKLSGRHVKGEDKPLFAAKPEELRAAIDAAAASLPVLVEKFADPATPYLAKPHPSRGTYRDTYAGMSRAGEWGGQGDDNGA